MNILINASNLKDGGGIQVANSLCLSLGPFTNHHFTVVLSSYLGKTAEFLKEKQGITVVRYDIRNSFSTLLFGRDLFLDSLVEKNKIDCVLTIFGPSRWIPRCPHICGFARLQLLCPESPYFSIMSPTERAKNWISNTIIRYMFIRSSRCFFTENEWVTKRFLQAFPGKECTTITNYYNQIYDSPSDWVDCHLPLFDGCTILNIGSGYPHKNLRITIEIARGLKIHKPEFHFRFVMTVTEKEFPIPDDIRDCFLLIGRVDITQCPQLYQQADIMFQPSLLECFTATYPEAMRMQVPIITTDLSFAHSLCGNAAIYYSPLDASDAANCIFQLATRNDIRKELVYLGNQQLQRFDNYTVRAEKLISLCESQVQS